MNGGDAMKMPDSGRMVTAVTICFVMVALMCSFAMAQDDVVGQYADTY